MTMETGGRSLSSPTPTAAPSVVSPSPLKTKLYHHEDELTEGTTTDEEAVGLGGLPSEAQLVLLCLDYLRDLRRSYPTPVDMEKAEGLNADAISLAIYALSRSFCRPAVLTHAKSNDPWWDKPAALSSELRLAANLDVDSEILYRENPHDDDDDEDSEEKRDDDPYSWYEYDDAHPSNVHRFYPLNGLASGPSLRGPLTLGEIAAAGLAGLGARSRLDAEREMMKSPLFEQFVSAVQSKGFFNEKDEQYEERYAKVVAKFRTKLAAKAEAPTSHLVALSAADRQRKRRGTRIVKARKRPTEAMQIPTPSSSIVTNLAKKLAPPSRGFFKGDESTDSQMQQPCQNPVDVDEAEKLKAQGNSCMQRKEYQQAADAYTQALKLCPAGPHSHVYFSNRAAALLSMKQFQEAIVDSERSLALKPDYGKAHARLGLAHFLLGNYRQAMEAYTVSLKYEPDNKSSKNYLEKAAKRVAASKEKADSNREIQSTASASFSVVSEWDKSDKRDVDVKEAEKAKTKGNAYMASREYTQALDAYSAAIRVCPDGPHSHVYFSNRAAALCYLERYEEAEVDSERSLALNPTYGKAHARLGLSRFFLADYEGAVDAYTAALQYDPKNAASKSYLAKAKAKLAERNASKNSEKDASPIDNARRLLKDPEMQLMAKKAMQDPSLRLLDDPEMQRMAKKAMQDPSLRQAVMAGADRK